MLTKIFAKIERFIPKKWRWVLSHEGFKRYFANTGWMFFGQMFNLGLSFCIGIWMARYLGPENYGILNYVLAFVGLFAFIADLGVNSILNRELVKFPEKRDELLGTALRLKIGGGIVAFLVTVCVIFFTDASPLIRGLVVLYSLTFILQSVNVISTFFQARVEAKNNVRSQIISSSISSVLKIVMILSGFGVIWLMLIYVLDFIWLGIALAVAYRRSGLKIMSWSFNWLIAKEILSSSWLLMLSSASTFIYMRIDQVMIGNFLGEKEVGLYSAAVKLSEIWYFIPGVICGSLFPAIVNAKKSNLIIYYNRLRKLYWFLFIISFLISVAITFLAPFIIQSFFGLEYLNAIPILRVYVWSTIGSFMGWAIGQYFLIENRVKILFYYTVFSMFINIILNIVLIPKIGSVGAALATSISYSIGPIVVYIFNKVYKNNVISSQL